MKSEIAIILKFFFYLLVEYKNLQNLEKLGVTYSNDKWLLLQKCIKPS